LGKTIGETQKCYVSWIHDTLPINFCLKCSPDSCSILTASNDIMHVNVINNTNMDNDNNMDEDDNNINLNNDKHSEQLVAELTLCPAEVTLATETEFNNIGEVIKNENEDENKILLEKLTYNNFDNIELKIISFPHLKEKIEMNLCCQKCVREWHRSSITIVQTHTN